MSLGPPTIHASCVSVRGRGILIRGAPGAGKSSLVLALIDDPRRDAILVADDRVALRRHDDHLVAAVPESLRGRVEVRGVGILRRPFRPEARVHLVVDLVAPADAPRMPEPSDAAAEIEGIALPRLVLSAAGAENALRVRAALP